MTAADAPPAGRRAAVFWSFAAIYIVWGSTYLAIRVVVESFPPFLAAGARFLLAGALLYGCCGDATMRQREL